MKTLRFIRNLFLNLLRFPSLSLKKNKLSLSKVYLSSGTRLRGCDIGNYTFVGPNCLINFAEVGPYSCIAAGVQIGGMEHPYWDKTISPKLTDEYIMRKKTVIGHDVWIGANVIIKQGVNIGNGAVIGAHSFVNKDVPSYAIYFGTPANLFKYRDCKKFESDLNQSEYWLYKPQKAKIMLSQIGKK